MRIHWHILGMIGLGAVLVALTISAVLLYGDAQEALALPSHLYQANNPTWPVGIPWWIGAGLAAGLVAGGFTSLSLRTEGPTPAFAMYSLGVVLSLAVLSYRNFDFAPQLRTVANYFTIYGINVVFFLVVTIMPTLVGVVLSQIVIPSRVKRRSIADIAPKELQQIIADRKANEKLR